MEAKSLKSRCPQSWLLLFFFFYWSIVALQCDVTLSGLAFPSHWGHHRTQNSFLHRPVGPQLSALYVVSVVYIHVSADGCERRISASLLLTDDSLLMSLHIILLYMCLLLWPNFRVFIRVPFLVDSVQFSCSVVSDSLRPHESQHARPPCPSPTPRVHSDSRSSSQWCHPAISSSVISFSSCPQSLPASESFPVSQLVTWGGLSKRSRRVCMHYYIHIKYRKGQN